MSLVQKCPLSSLGDRCRAGLFGWFFLLVSGALAEHTVAAAPAEVPLGLPPLEIPANNSLTEERVALGRKLFFDRRLSFNGTLSCGMCHVPEQAFTQNELRTSVGAEGRFVKRNAPSLINVAYRSSLFHDGRESSLEHQVWQPLLKQNEMANPSIGHVLATIQSSADYDGLFESAYGQPVGMESLGMALASYQRSLIMADSDFDRWRYGGDKEAMSVASRRGWQLFQASGCSACHRVGESDALFADGLFHDTGIGYARAMGLPVTDREVLLAPGLTVSPEVSFEMPVFSDLGRYEATGRSEDRWRYQTPSLRNVALTYPYMHDGSLPDLRSVLDYYNSGGVPGSTQDARIRPLGLSESELQDLEAFLRALTGRGLSQLQRDARTAEIGDVGGVAP